MRTYNEEKQICTHRKCDGGCPVEEGARGIMWASTFPDNGQVEDFSLMARLYHGEFGVLH